MSDISTEQLAKRIHECGLMEQKDINALVAGAGGPEIDLDVFVKALVSKEKLTNFQIQRMLEGQVRGYFYGKWKVLYLVGAGTFARVYRGVHTETGEVKAIKVLRSRWSSEIEKVDDFKREATMVMTLRHPNIVPIYEVDTDRDRCYMVMDFVEGQNLRDFVRTHQKLDLMTSLKLAHDLASGLEHASLKGITHRDMKLSNVLLSSKGQAKLVDFGLASISQDDGTDDGVARSIDYAGLERLTKAVRNDPRSDIFFLGCMLYHMLAGKPAMSEDKQRSKRLSAQRYKEIQPITNLVDGLPHRVVILVNRLIELDPDKRIQSAAETVSEIEAAIQAIEKGQVEKYDETLAEQHAAEYAQSLEKQKEGQGRTVMLVESDIKLQDSLRKRLKALGYRVLIFGNPSTAFSRFDGLDPAEEQPADVVLFGCKGLGKQGLMEFNNFGSGEYTAHVPCVLLLADGQNGYQSHAEVSEHRLCLAFPLKFGHVRKAIRQLIVSKEANV